MTTTINAQDLTFGVEIETAIPVVALQARGWTVSGYHHGTGNETRGAFPGWKIERDSSIHTPGYDFAAAEFVSPVLKGAVGLAQVKALVETLRSMGAKVNASTGLHIHVGFAGDGKALKRLIHLVANAELGLFASTGSRAREVGTYCKPIKGDFRAVEAMDDVKTLQDVAQVYTTSDRYHSLNLTNILRGRFQAVEFRIFAGTLNVAKMLGHIQMCLGLVQKALTGRGMVTFDTPALSVNSPYYRQGLPGTTDLNRIFGALGWNKSSHKTARLGVLVDDETLKVSMNVLRKMAKKYDERRAR